MTARELITDATYLVASVLFILGLRSLTRPETARRGMQLAAFGMLAAICGTLMHHEIVSYGGVLVGLGIGTLIGWPLGTRVAMTAMPQRIAISHLFGALAATLVGVAEFYSHRHAGEPMPRGMMGALAFEVLFGALTVSGSFVAFGKLQELLPGRPLTFRGQNVMNVSLFAGAVALGALLVAEPETAWAFYALVGLSFVIGFSMVLPIGGADMPVVVSLLNSYAGLAASATGFAIGNNVLIICGALDGASGFLLSILMSKAMNRSFGNVLFGAFGAAPAGPRGALEERPMKAISAEDAAATLAFARRVVVVPGYGLAVAQAQQLTREMADQIEKRGGDVKYAIHPVAGRMPGHMNVLLAEANVQYEKMVEMEEINEHFSSVDVAVVIGANDVVNPAAKRDPKSPIFGMPILDVDQARQVFVLKRGKGAGFAGIDNDLFFEEKTSLIFGDAKASLQKLVAEMKAL
ncbi:MAG TPA: NAD(P)(+) transhydrogenase (Re/Si-specific) subunit beta [Polyangiaceae bacterium]|nr:NAD(P)(+) transhydrogenase (Re/Si-specific) subunit beta [Polyangiaceae bacterium]